MYTLVYTIAGIVLFLLVYYLVFAFLIPVKVVLEADVSEKGWSIRSFHAYHRLFRKEYVAPRYGCSYGKKIYREGVFSHVTSGEWDSEKTVSVSVELRDTRRSKSLYISFTLVQSGTSRVIKKSGCAMWLG